MTKSLRFAVLAAFLSLVALVSRAQSNAIVLTKSPEITADQMESTSNGCYLAQGHVWIKYADHELRADKVEISQTSGDVHAMGHIELLREGMGRWTGEDLHYNYITKEGLSIGSQSSAIGGHFAITAQETRRDTNGTLHLLHARVTTCTNDVDHWHYWISGRRMDYRDKDRVTLYDAVPYFMGVPLFYLPYVTRDLNHPFGPRILPGFQSSWGAYLLTTYTYPIYNPPGQDEVWGNVLLDFRSERGVAYGHELDWVQETIGRGRFGVYAADDLKANSRYASTTNHIDSERYRFYFTHEADPTPNDQVLAQGDYLSDYRMMDDFFRRTFREMSQPDNFVEYTHRALTYAVGADVSGPMNKFYDGVGHLPEAWITAVPQELFPESGLYYESDTRVGFYAQQWSDESSLTNTPYRPDAIRFQSLQKLTYPFHVLDVVNVVPRAAYNYTYYSDLPDNTNQVRSIFETGVTASFKTYADYGSYRHVLEPYLDYSLISSPLNVKSNFFYDRFDGPRDWGNLFGIDGNYAPRRWNGVLPGVRNSIQTRDEDGTAHTLLNSDTFFAYRFEGNSSSNGLMMAGWNLGYHPYRWLDFHTEGLYDTVRDRMDMADTGVTIGRGTDTQVEVDLFRTDPMDPGILHTTLNPALTGTNAIGADTQISCGVTHRFTDMWSANVAVSYDLTHHNTTGVSGYLQYELDCVAFRLNSGMMPPYTDSNGVRRPVDFSIAFEVWIKAIKPDNIDHLRGGWSGAPAGLSNKDDER